MGPVLLSRSQVLHKGGLKPHSFHFIFKSVGSPLIWNIFHLDTIGLVNSNVKNTLHILAEDKNVGSTLVHRLRVFGWHYPEISYWSHILWNLKYWREVLKLKGQLRLYWLHTGMQQTRASKHETLAQCWVNDGPSRVCWVRVNGGMIKSQHRVT